MFRTNFKKILKNRNFLTLFLIALICFLTISYFLQEQLINTYNTQNSLIVQDRTGKIIFIEPNEKGNWSEYLNKIPSQFKKLLIRKEDKYFYYHFGFNPWSTFRAVVGYLGLGPKRASSTITQQLVKILLGKESERNPKNKIIEAFYTLSLEIFQSKETILKMYANSVYLGNQAQGLSEASKLYFNLSPDMLTKGQIIQLLSTISSPTKNNPSKKEKS